MSRDRDTHYAIELGTSLDRDFYAEGYDAALAGNSDTPPPSVQELGPDAEGEWLDGYRAFCEEEEADANKPPGGYGL